jgi:hypothetical protein
MRKIKKQINEIIGAWNKQKTETENTINNGVDNIKEEVTHNMENLRKKNETEIQNKMKAIPTE